MNRSTRLAIATNIQKADVWWCLTYAEWILRLLSVAKTLKIESLNEVFRKIAFACLARACELASGQIQYPDGDRLFVANFNAGKITSALTVP